MPFIASVRSKSVKKVIFSRSLIDHSPFFQKLCVIPLCEHPLAYNCRQKAQFTLSLLFRTISSTGKHFSFFILAILDAYYTDRPFIRHPREQTKIPDTLGKVVNDIIDLEVFLRTWCSQVLVHNRAYKKTLQIRQRRPFHLHCCSFGCYRREH